MNFARALPCIKIIKMYIHHHRQIPTELIFACVLVDATKNMLFIFMMLLHAIEVGRELNK